MAQTDASCPPVLRVKGTLLIAPSVQPPVGSPRAESSLLPLPLDGSGPLTRASTQLCSPQGLEVARGHPEPRTKLDENVPKDPWTLLLR